MKEEICTIIVCLICLTCVTYRRIGLVIPKGASLKVYSSYGESFHFYDILAYYVENADIEKTVTRDTFDKNEYEVVAFNLIQGNKTALLLEGEYSPYPGTTAHAGESFSLYISLDSIVPRDTIYFERDGIGTTLYYTRMADFLYHREYTEDLEGYILINSITDDTLSGFIRFSGDTHGSYFSFLTNRTSDFSTSSWVSGRIQYKATREKVKEKTIGGVLLPTEGENKSEN